MQLFFSACSAQPIYGCHRCHRWMIWQISKSWACWDIRERQKDPPQRLWVGAFCQNCQCLFLSFARSLDPKHSVSFAPWQAGISRRRQGGLSKLNKKKELLIDEQTISMQKCLRFSGQQRRSSIRLEAKNMHACRNLINNKAPSAEASWGGVKGHLGSFFPIVSHLIGNLSSFLLSTYPCRQAFKVRKPPLMTWYSKWVISILLQGSIDFLHKVRFTVLASLVVILFPS